MRLRVFWDGGGGRTFLRQCGHLASQGHARRSTIQIESPKHLPGQHAESERPVGHSSNAIAIAVSESIACPSFQRAANRGSPNSLRAALT